MKTEFELVFIFCAYLVGSIPFGYIFTKKITGINICQCKNCNNGNYIRKNKIEPRSTSPPLIKGAIK